MSLNADFPCVFGESWVAVGNQDSPLIMIIISTGYCIFYFLEVPYHAQEREE